MARAGDYFLLFHHREGIDPTPIAALLLIGDDQLYAHFRDRYDFLEDPADREVFSAFASDFGSLIKDMGPRGTIEWMLTTLSNAIQITDPRRVETDDPQATVLQLLSDAISRRTVH